MDEKMLMNLMGCFLRAARDDPRMATIHISLFVVLLELSYEKNEQPLCVFSHEVMPSCKIVGASTYHRTIRQLHQYGYIRYVPSYNHFLGSLVFFIPIPIIGDRLKQTERVIYSLDR